MSTEFEASNGIKIKSTNSLDGVLVCSQAVPKWRDTGNYIEGSPVDQALAEWYQHRRDLELGRWRDPEAPEYVVYTQPGERFMRVTNEIRGTSYLAWKDSTSVSTPTVARYLAAHREPKPGEVWLVTAQEEYRDEPAIVQDGRFYFSTKYGFNEPDSIHVDNVIAARRIYPPEED